MIVSGQQKTKNSISLRLICYDNIILAFSLMHKIFYQGKKVKLTHKDNNVHENF